MNEPIELVIESPDGIIDCRLEPQWINDELSYSVTILYPQMVNGYNRSEIYCYTLLQHGQTGNYSFESGDESILPKIMELETQLSKAIKQSR